VASWPDRVNVREPYSLIRWEQLVVTAAHALVPSGFHCAPALILDPDHQCMFARRIDPRVTFRSQSVAVPLLRVPVVDVPLTVLLSGTPSSPRCRPAKKTAGYFCCYMHICVSSLDASKHLCFSTEALTPMFHCPIGLILRKQLDLSKCPRPLLAPEAILALLTYPVTD
jgi:hypothetical protein